MSIEDAHRALLRDEALQFDGKASPMRPDPLAGWHWGGSDMLTLIAIVVALVVLVIVVLAVRAARKGRSPAAPAPAPSDAAPALALRQQALRDADALAAEGRFLDAAHMLLGCGVAEIARRFPNSLRPITTSRDIAAMASLPEPIRTAFGRIAATVEIGLFGGRPLSETQFLECRVVFVTSALAAGP